MAHQWCQESTAGRQQVQSVQGDWTGLKGQRANDRDEMMVLMICSPAELRKRVGTVIPSSVERFVGTVGLDLPTE